MLARRYGVVNQLNRVDGRHRATTGSASSPAGTPTTSCARRCVCSGSPTTTSLRARRHPPAAAVDADAARRRQPCASSPTACRGGRRRGEEPDARAAREERAVRRRNERPLVVGRPTSDGAPLVPGTGTLDADAHAGGRCARASPPRLGDDRLRPLPAGATRSLIPLTVNRTPFFCTGCPHNISTRVPDGTLVGGGIGCHTMVALMEPDRVGDIVGLTAMGNEGAQWIGMAPFVDRDHLVQNLGDGTFFHSGSLAIRAAVRGRRQHHLQAALQRHRGDDRRPGPAGSAARARGRRSSLLLEGVRAGHRHHRRSGRVRRRRVRPACRDRRRGVGPAAPDRGAGGAGHGARRHGADPRPALRRREPPGAQPRQAGQARLPGRHQRAGVRGLRRLRRQEQLPVGAAGRHRVRAARRASTRRAATSTCRASRGDCPAFATVTVDADGSDRRRAQIRPSSAIPPPGSPSPRPLVPATSSRSASRASAAPA